MTQELIYTSAEKGLRLGSRGFCTVASSAGMAKPLADRLEALSGYRHLHPPGSASAHLNPINFSYLTFKFSGGNYYVLSRIADAGLDHTQRSNKIAHHILLSSSELVPAGPAWIASQVGFFTTKWNVEPHIIAQSHLIPQGDLKPTVCRAWQAATGDAGWGGVLAESAVTGKEAYVIYPAGTNVLQLVLESQSLLTTSQRWAATFSTYYMKLPPGVECRWRFLPDGTPEAQLARRSPGQLVIDLCAKLPTASASPLVQAARTGKSSLPPAPQPTALTAEVVPPVSSGLPHEPAEFATTYSVDAGVALPPTLPPRVRGKVWDRELPRRSGRRRVMWIVLLAFVLLGGVTAIATYVLINNKSVTPQEAKRSQKTQRSADRIGVQIENDGNQDQKESGSGLSTHINPGPADPLAENSKSLNDEKMGGSPNTVSEGQNPSTPVSANEPPSSVSEVPQKLEDSPPEIPDLFETNLLTFDMMALLKVSGPREKKFGKVTSNLAFQAFGLQGTDRPVSNLPQKGVKFSREELFWEGPNKNKLARIRSGDPMPSQLIFELVHSKNDESLAELANSSLVVRNDSDQKTLVISFTTERRIDARRLNWQRIPQTFGAELNVDVPEYQGANAQIHVKSKSGEFVSQISDIVLSPVNHQNEKATVLDQKSNIQRFGPKDAFTLKAELRRPTGSRAVQLVVMVSGENLPIENFISGLFEQRRRDLLDTIDEHFSIIQIPERPRREKAITAWNKEWKRLSDLEKKYIESRPSQLTEDLERDEAEIRAIGPENLVQLQSLIDGVSAYGDVASLFHLQDEMKGLSLTGQIDRTLFKFNSNEFVYVPALVIQAEPLSK